MRGDPLQLYSICYSQITGSRGKDVGISFGGLTLTHFKYLRRLQEIWKKIKHGNIEEGCQGCGGEGGQVAVLIRVTRKGLSEVIIKDLK